MGGEMRAEMTSRERVLTALRRQVPDRVPKNFGWTEPVLALIRSKIGAGDPYEFFRHDTRHVVPRPSAHPGDFAPYFAGLNLPPDTRIDEWGMAEIPDPGVHYTTYVHPMARLTSADEIETYPWPDSTAAYRWAHVAGEVKDWHVRGMAIEAWLECTIFERAWYMRSMDALLTDFAENPEFANALLDRITEESCGRAALFARADVDVLALGDDVAMQTGMMLGPATWRRWLKPRLARVIAAAKTIKPDVLIRYHSDGDCRAIIPELIEIGVDVLNPVQPVCMDPAEVKREYGDRLAFWGTMGTQTTMPFGTPADVAAVVRERVATVGAGGGLFLAPTHVLQPDVPWENIVAFVDAVEKYGVYA
jgi:uroporphyrinogen decarboxylase